MNEQRQRESAIGRPGKQQSVKTKDVYRRSQEERMAVKARLPRDRSSFYLRFKRINRYKRMSYMAILLFALPLFLFSVLVISVTMGLEMMVGVPSFIDWITLISTLALIFFVLRMWHLFSEYELLLTKEINSMSLIEEHDLLDEELKNSGIHYAEKAEEFERYIEEQKK